MSLLPVWRRDEKGPVSTFQSEMNRLVEDFFGRPLLRGFWGDGDRFLPAMDVRETEDKVIIEAELPGMEPKDVDIKIEGDSLVISGERKQEKEQKTKGYHRIERAFGRFQRELELPYGSDPNKVDATYTNGVLTIEIGKKEEAKKKTIQVKVK